MRVISHTSEYALRALIWLVREPGGPQTARQVATGTRMPPHYVTKVLQLLAKAGLVSAHRGVGGGFRLDVDPARITMLDVIQAVDPLEPVRPCPLCARDHDTIGCALHGGLSNMWRQLESILARTRIADLLDRSLLPIPPSGPCHAPPPAPAQPLARPSHNP